MGQKMLGHVSGVIIRLFLSHDKELSKNLTLEAQVQRYMHCCPESPRKL